jgi:hypothetical protein
VTAATFTHATIDELSEAVFSVQFAVTATLRYNKGTAGRAKAFRTFIRIYSLLKSERLSAKIKLTLHKALIRSVMTYACSA